MFPSGFHSDDESADRTPLSKRAKDIQSQVVTLPKDKPVISISNSPKKQKKRSAEDAEPSSPKKRKVARKGETALKLVDSDDIDNIIDEVDLQTSDDVRFPRSKDVRL